MGVEEGTSNGDGTECSEGLRCVKTEVVDDGVRIGIRTTDAAGWSSGLSEGFRTYKRRKHVKSCAESKLQDDGKAYAKAAIQLGQQVCFCFVFVPKSSFIDSRIAFLYC